MKKFLIILPITFIVTLVFANNLLFRSSAREASKQINVAIFSNSDYSSDAYNKALAQVDVVVKKISGNKTAVINTQSFTGMSLKQYPAAQNALTSKLDVHTMTTATDYLVVEYIVTYNSNGSVIKFSKEEMLGKGNGPKELKIGL